MNWKIGDIAVCVAQNPDWAKNGVGESFIGPQYMESNEVVGYFELGGDLYLHFPSYKYGYHSVEFKKQEDVSAELSEGILESVLTTIEEPIEV